MAELETRVDFLKCLIPISGDKRWHDVNVETRTAMRKEGMSTTFSYGNEISFYVLKYGTPLVLFGGNYL